jgi:surface polysaccharide O-acyltransferase-like enzyme
MEIFLFTLNAIVVYLFSDWLLRAVETRRGTAIPYRQAVFFVIFLSLALLSFRLLRVILSA